jgi:hypothetical protein
VSDMGCAPSINVVRMAANTSSCSSSVIFSAATLD